MSAKNLVIVESPAKAKTIEGYLGKDFVVKSSFGHVRDLPKDDKAIDIQNGFLPKYEVSPDKTKVVNELRKMAKEVDDVWLATDDDREGEAISWHLKEALNLPSHTKRIVFREITKNAIQNAIKTPRIIDMDLVNAQQARRVLDRLIGFELSPVLWSKVRSGLSAGRVQSVAVRIVVDREREIERFNSTSSFKIVAIFDLNEGKILTAELPKNFSTETEALRFLEKCNGAVFNIKNLETKPAKKSPAPPFTTSTLQQEASRKLSFSVSQTMIVAQKLYEAGKISYMRTDSTNLSSEAIEKAKAQITVAYGADFSQVRQYKTKSDSAQEAHEAIRPTDFAESKASSDRNEQRLYELIWKRAIASQMADARLERTTAAIGISTVSQELVAQGEVIKFEGFLKVYLESKDDDDEENKGMLPPLNVGQILDLNTLKATERFSRPPARYTEASLVKALEEMGIGRPSTYAPTISTIIKREYITKEDREGKEREFREYVLKFGKIGKKISTENYGSEKAKLFPTNIGMVVNDFLVLHFQQYVDFDFTATMEREFDDISEGKLEWQFVIENFYKSFHKTIEDSSQAGRSSATSAKILGIDPKTGKTISVRLGKYGPFAQIGEAEGEEKPIYAPLKKGQLLSSITLEEAIELFKLPREVGFFEEKPIIANIGRFGPYLKFEEKFINLPKEEDPLIIEIDKAIEIILLKRKENTEGTLGMFEEMPISSGKGKFGPFVKHNDKYYSLPKGEELEALTNERSIEIILKKRNLEANKFIKEFAERPEIKVVNGIYGPYLAVGKRNIKLPKDTDAATLTLEDCLKLAEGDAPAKTAKLKKKV